MGDSDAVLASLLIALLGPVGMTTRRWFPLGLWMTTRREMVREELLAYSGMRCSRDGLIPRKYSPKSMEAVVVAAQDICLVTPWTLSGKLSRNLVKGALSAATAVGVA